MDERKILIVEDDETSQIYIKVVMKSKYKFLLVAKNGKEAVDLFTTNPDIDVILMDIRMPVMNGFEALEEIRKMSKDVFIVAQSAFALDGDEEKFLKAGFNAFLPKPIERDRLFELLNKRVADN